MTLTAFCLVISILLLGCGAAPAPPPAHTVDPDETPTEAQGSTRAEHMGSARPPAQAGTAEPEEPPPQARGSLSAEHIRTVVRSHTADIRACYEAALGEDPELRGRIVIRFVVQPDGTVGEAVATSSDLGHPGVEACILEHARTWRFDPPMGNGIVIVNYPFVLETE